MLYNFTVFPRAKRQHNSPHLGQRKKPLSTQAGKGNSARQKRSGQVIVHVSVLSNFGSSFNSISIFLLLFEVIII